MEFAAMEVFKNRNEHTLSGLASLCLLVKETWRTVLFTATRRVSEHFPEVSKVTALIQQEM
jgi:hypothetical protein